MKPRRLLPFTAAITCVLTASAHAGDVIKANNTTDLNLAGSWLSGTPIPPDSTSVVVWNSTVTAANATVLGANTSWQGIKIVNPTGLVTINNGNTLTLGSSGIDIASTSAGISIRTAVTLGVSQSFVIGNSSAAQDLLFDSPSSGLAFNMGGFTVGTSGLGTMRFTSGHTISNGIFNLDNAVSEFQSGGSRTMTLNSNVTLNLAAGKQLVFGINSAPSGGLAVSSAAAINITSGTLQINTAQNANSSRLEQSGKLSFSGTSTVNNTSFTGTGSAYFSNFSGEIALAGTTTWNETGGSTANTTISGPLTGNGVLNYRGTSSSHRTDLSGNNSLFAGTINLDGGSGSRNLRLTTANSGSASATWSPSTGNILQVDGVAVNLGTLNGAGTVTNSHATNVARITVGAGAFSGAITNGAPALGMSLTKNTAGTLALTGANTYTGLTDIQGGTLQIGTGGSIANSNSITLAAGATFDVSAFASYTLANNLTLSGNGAVSGNVNDSTGTQLLAGGATAVGTLTFNNDLNLNGTGTAAFNFSSPTTGDKIIVTGNLTPTGTTNLLVSSQPTGGFTTSSTYNLFEVGNTLNGAASNFNLVNNTRSSLSLAYSGKNVVMTVDNGVGPQNIVWVGGVGGNVWDITNTANWDYEDLKYYDEDHVSFTGAGAANSPVTLNTTVRPTSVTVDSSSGDYLISGTGTIAGTTGLAKSGSSALTLATSNTFVGGVQLNAGTLNVNHANALGTGTLTIAGGTTLNNTSGSAKVATNVQNWNGDFTFTGTNDLTLGAAAMNASRQVTVSAGTLTVGGISGSGFGLTKAGAGTLAVGASSYSGATVVSAGTLKATSATSFTTTSSVTLANTAGVTLDLNGNSQTISNLTGGGATGGNVVLGGATLTTGIATDTTIGGLSGAGGLVKNNAGRLSILGDKSGYTGTTTVSGGTLDLGTINGNFGATVTVTSGTATNSISVGSNLFVEGNGLLTTGISGGSAGFGARGGNLTVNVGGAGAMINRDSSGSRGLGQMIFGSATSDSRVIVQNGIGINNFGGTRDITVNAGTGTASAEIAGVISAGGAGGISGIVKKGNGELILSNANTYTGPTTVSAGTLTLTGAGSISTSNNYIVNGTLNVTGITPSTFTVATGKTLSGTGTVNATGKTLSIEGTHAVGNSNVGQQSISGTASYAAGSIFEWQLGSNVETGRGTAFDAVNVTGTLDIDGTASTGAVFKIVLGTAFDGGDAFWLANRSWDVFTATTSTTAFTNIQVYDFDDLVNQVSYETFGSFSYGFTGGTGTLTWSAVPEPTSALAGLLLGAGLLRRRRK